MVERSGTRAFDGKETADPIMRTGHENPGTPGSSRFPAAHTATVSIRAMDPMEATILPKFNGEFGKPHATALRARLLRRCSRAASSRHMKTPPLVIQIRP